MFDDNEKNNHSSPNIAQVLLSINSFEEFKNLKTNIETLEQVAKTVLRIHHLPEAPLTLFSEGTNIVFDYDGKRVIKIFPPMHLDQFKSELLVLNHLHGKLSIPTPIVEFHGDIIGWPYIVMTKLEGTSLELLWAEMNHHNKMLIMKELGTLIYEVHSLPTHGIEAIDCHWQEFISRQIEHCVENHKSKNLPHNLIDQIPSYLESIMPVLLKINHPVLLTGEYTPMNLLVKKTHGIWHIAGLIDFGDCMLGAPAYDLLGPGAFLIQGDKSLLKAFLIAYGYTPDLLTEALSHYFTALMLLHQYSNLNSQLRIKDWKKTAQNLKDLENLAWGFT